VFRFSTVSVDSFNPETTTKVMKANLLTNLLFLAAFIGVIYLGFHLLEPDSPSLNDKALSPDVHFSNVRKYIKEHEYERGQMHLTKAIETMRIIEADADIHSGEVLEQTITDLERIRPWLNEDSILVVDLNTAISKALTALSLAELRVSETYAETNKLKMANIALRYGMLHLKHALDFSGGELREREKHIYKEVDSLLKHPGGYSVDVTLKIDHMVHELDSLLAQR